MKIKGWEKISGYTYKGYSIVNPMHNAGETKYFATVLDLNNPQKPKWELSVITSEHKFMIGDSTRYNSFFVIVRDDEGRSTTSEIHKDRMKSISIFRNTFEEMIDKLLSMRLTSAYSNKTINPNNYGTLTVAGTGNGILSTIQTHGNNVVWDPTTNLPSSMLIAIKDLQKQIDELKIKQ